MFRLLSSVFAVGFCSMSTAAIAAEVVEMRLGRHADFTRVVFQLDAPAGYSLEQNTLEDGTAELVVTLDASATTQEMKLGRSLVKSVQLTGKGRKSVARIRLGSGQLRVKEMILGSPPRIVLDVLAPAGAARTAKAMSSPMGLPKATPSEPAVQAAAKPKPISVSQPNRRRGDSSPVASINRAATQTPERVAKRPAPTPAARPAPTPKGVAPAKPKPVVAQKRPAVVPKAPAATKVPAAGKKPTAPTRTLAAKPAKTPPPPARKKNTVRPGTLPAAPAALPKSNSLFTATNIGGGLALLGLVGGGTFFMLRRRKGSEMLDVSDFEDDTLGADNPFAEIDEDSGVIDSPSQMEETAEIPMANVVDEFDPNDDADVPVAKVAADSEPDQSLFDTSATEILSAEDTDTNVNLPDAPNAEGSGDNMEAYGDATTGNTNEDTMPPIPGVGAGDGSDTMRMLREFEQRMASLEARLDEVSEAKERLERQVAAQTEELRVQRAAIARTQRALRNLSRPDEASPTEPALRDPNA